MQLYESNNESSVMAGLIRGPCEVLPPGKFKEENERLNHLGNEANKGRHPVFLCQYVFLFLSFHTNPLPTLLFRRCIAWLVSNFFRTMGRHLRYTVPEMASKMATAVIKRSVP